MLDIFRDSAFGTALNYVSGGRVLPYRDQLPGYKIPDRYMTKPVNNSPATSNPVTRVPTTEEKNVLASDPEDQKPKLEGSIVASIDPFIVSWDGEDDPDNPR